MDLQNLWQKSCKQKYNCKCNFTWFIETDMTDKLSDEQKQAIVSAIPLSRMGSSKDIADITLFLASDGSYIQEKILM